MARRRRGEGRGLDDDLCPSLDGVEGVVDWFAGSGLIPFLEPLDAAERQAFLSRYRAAIEESYAPRADGKVLLPYPRLFIVARR